MFFVMCVSSFCILDEVVAIYEVLQGIIPGLWIVFSLCIL